MYKVFIENLKRLQMYYFFFLKQFSGLFFELKILVFVFKNYVEKIFPLNKILD